MLLKLTFACLIVWIFLSFSPRSIKMEIQRKSKRLHATKKSQLISPVLFQETLRYSFSVPSNSLKICILHISHMLLNPQNLTGSLRQSILIVAESSGPLLCCVQTVWWSVISCTRICGVFRFHTTNSACDARAQNTRPQTFTSHKTRRTKPIISHWWLLILYLGHFSIALANEAQHLKMFCF